MGGPIFVTVGCGRYRCTGTDLGHSVAAGVRHSAEQCATVPLLRSVRMHQRRGMPRGSGRTGPGGPVIGWLLAAASALLYGISDVVGGLAARRAHFAVVALVGQVAGLVVTAATCLLAGAGPPVPSDLAWGAVSGVGTATGMVFLFRGIATGAMSVVVPTSAVTGLAVPVVVEGLVGARPPLGGWAGIAVAVPALWLVSGGRSVTSGGRYRARPGIRRNRSRRAGRLSRGDAPRDHGGGGRGALAVPGRPGTSRSHCAA